MERAIHISSINREKTGESRPDNFVIKFNPALKLDRELKHFLAIDRLTIQAYEGMFCSLICIKSRNNHNIAEICRKALKLGHPIELDDLSSFSV